MLITKELRIHGRGGQGIVKAAEIIVQAIVDDGKFANSIPFFGFERQGAPVVSFVRIGDQPIRQKTQVYHPDCVLVLDDTVINAVDIYAGLQPDSIVVINSKSKPADIKVPETVGKLAIIDASSMALKILGVDKPNTVILGAFAAATGWADCEKIAFGAVKAFGHRNADAVKAGFAEVQIVSEGLSRLPEKKKKVEPTKIYDYIAPIGIDMCIVDTGAWKVQRPIFSDTCNSCGLCAIHCPTGCIKVDKQKGAQASLDFCKGCAVCSGICPRKAISMQEEGARFLD